MTHNLYVFEPEQTRGIHTCEYSVAANANAQHISNKKYRNVCLSKVY